MNRPESRVLPRQRLRSAGHGQAPRRPSLLALPAVACGYFAASELGFAVTGGHEHLQATAPALGVALAAALLWGLGVLPAIALAAAAAAIAQGLPVGAVAGFSAAAAAAVAAATMLLRRVDFRPALERVRDVIALAALGALAGAIGATIGVLSLMAFAGLGSAHIAGTWRIWWLGEIGGVTLVCTALLAIAHVSRSEFGQAHRVRAALRRPQVWAALLGVLIAALATWLLVRAHGADAGARADDLARLTALIGVGTFAVLLVAAARTERLLAEAASAGLAESERALADAQRLARIGSFTWDLETGVLTCSDELFNLFGLARTTDPLSYLDWRAMVHEEDLPRADAAVQHALDTRQPFSFVARVVRPDGNTRTLECHGRVQVVNEEPARVLGTCQDVTAVRLAEERFRTLFEAAPYGLVVLDASGEVVLVNAELERLFGYSRWELVGDSVERVIPTAAGAELGWYREPLDGTAKRKGELELHGIRKDGSEFPLEVSLTPLRTEEETLISAAVKDVTERKLAAQVLAHQASHDPLTGLPNRTLFLDRLEHALRRARRSAQKLAVVFLDLDDFKLVNDTCGHEVGDRLLLTLTPRLTAALRPGDTIARFGGDEFVVLCEDVPGEAEAVRIAQRVADSCAESVVVDGHEHVITVSAGVVLVEDALQAGASSVLRDADAAMYRAKAGGKGRVEMFDADMRARLVERFDIEAQLRHAIERDELRLYFQPVVSLESGAVVAVEALVRWQHPERGLLEPAAFMPVAESSGLIVKIDEWVVREACREAAAWSRATTRGREPVHVSVNLSPRQIARPDVAACVADTLAGTGLDPSLLELEIIESTLLEDREGYARSLRELKSLGVKLVLDDFGIGYSSLSNLKRLTIDALKIDRSFVDGLGRDDEDGAIVNAVLSMARALEVGVTAEGVETQEQVARLRAHGCEFAQGYLFCPPTPAAEVRELISGDRLELLGV